MLYCFYCQSPLPGDRRRDYTSTVIKNLLCSPLCKIKSQIVSIDETGCWIFHRHQFTWGSKAYSVQRYIYSEFYRVAGPQSILMRCERNNCANPEHMEGFGKLRIVTLK